MSRRITGCTLALFLAILALSPRSAAQSEEPGPVQQDAPAQDESRDREARDQEELENELDTVIITATRSEGRLFDTPWFATVTGGDRINRSRTVQDALRLTPGVHVQRTSYGQTSPFLRGLTGYHTLMMIDGIRLNNSVLRSGPNEYWGLVDGFSLDRIEAVFGSGSVLYGSDAVGGSVNAIPLRREEYGPENSWDRRIALRFSSAEQSIIGRAEVSGNLGEDFGFVLGATGGAFGDLDAGGDLGSQPGTNYHNYFADGRFDFHLDDHWTLGLLAQLGRVENVDRVHGTVNGISYSGTSVGSDRTRTFDWDRDLVALFLDGTDLDLAGFIEEVHLRLSWQRIEETQNRVRSDGRINLSNFDVNTFGVALSFVSETPIGRLTWGVDFYHDEVDSSRTDFDVMGVPTVRIQGSVGDDSTYDLLGVFVQDEIGLCDSVDLILGGRFTYAAGDAGRVEDPMTGMPISVDDDWFNVTGSAQVLWRADEDLNFFGGVSQAFRAPNLSDISRLDSARSGELEVPSPGLDPETFLTFEGGVKVDSGGFAAEASYFYTIIDDLIIRQPTGAMVGMESVVQKRNGGDGHLQGVNFRARYDFCDNWWVDGTFQWVDGQAETFPTSAPVSNTEALSRLSPISGTVGVGWQTSERDFWVRGWTLLTDRQDRLNTRDKGDTSRIPPGGTPGYVILNLEAGYRIDEKSSVFLSVENLLDKNFRTHGSGVQEAGVNFILGADFTF